MTECSLSAAREPLAATAPHAAAYVIIEQPGPWGRDAITDSHLPDDVTAHLRTARGTGTTVLLARHPDRPERAHDGSRNVWIGFTSPGNVRFRHAPRATDKELLSLDFAGIAANSLPPLGDRTTARPLFICTHSGRDRCCAVYGRALVGDLLAQSTDRSTDRADVWECSHLGGHRFAPTALAMPSGTLYGRLDLGSAMELLEHMDFGTVDLTHYRGRSYFPQPLQAGEIAVRRQESIAEVDDLDVLWVRDGRAVPVAPGVGLEGIASALVEVRHMDGRAWRLQVRQMPLAEPRLESCGGDLVEGSAWVAGEISTLQPWTS